MENKHHINKMERLDASKLDVIAFKAINQKGYGDDIDRYIYSQSGEGLGSFFGNLVKKAIPILGKAIKGAAKGAAKATLPHLQEGGGVQPHDLMHTLFFMDEMRFREIS